MATSMSLRTWSFVAALLAGAACRDATSPSQGFTVEVLSTGIGPDTVLAPAPGPLVLKIRDGSGAAMAGTTVQLLAFPPGQDSTAPLRPLYICSLNTGPCATFSQYAYQVRWGVVDSTDAAGEVSVQLQHGVVAGRGGIGIKVTGYLAPDTLFFTTLPGHLARIATAVADTAVYAGHRYMLGAHAADRFLNLRPEPVASSTMTPAVAGVSGDTVSALGLGRGMILLTAGSVLDTAFVSVPPAGRLAMYDFHGWLTLVSTDGSGRRQLVQTVGHIGIAEPIWTPDGARVVFSEQGDSTGKVRLIATDTLGHRALFLSSDSVFSNTFQPAASADAVYFYGTLNSGYTGVFRAAPDGTGAFEVFPGVQPAPSPDGTRIAYINDMTVLVYATATGAAVTVGTFATRPRWSPSGDLVAFQD